MPVLTLWTPLGGVLSVVAPLAMGASVGTALVIDLDPMVQLADGGTTLADLVRSGPRRADLMPARRGVAILDGGGVDPADCTELIDALAAGWPRVVVRIPSRSEEPDGPGAVALYPLLPGPRPARSDRPAVHQRCGWRVRPAGPGPVLPRPSPGTVRAFLEHRLPGPSRWVRAWRDVWNHPWT